jgi:predicted metal-dependent hydrolase
MDDILDKLDRFFKPKMIAKDISVSALQSLPKSVKEYMKLLGSEGWRFYPVNQTRGRCYFGDKVITIPRHAFQREPEYLTYYICHEMAHAYAGWEANHGPEFMKEFKRICPQEYWKYELNYKPRNAKSAGIDDFDIGML